MYFRIAQKPIALIFFGAMDGETIHFTDIVGSVAILGGLYMARR